MLYRLLGALGSPPGPGHLGGDRGRGGARRVRAGASGETL